MAEAALTLDDTAVKATAVRHQKRRSAYRWPILVLLIVLVLGTLFPFFLAVINAIKTGVDYAVGGPLSIPTTIDFSALEKFWTLSDYTRKLANSVLISAGVAVFGGVLIRV
jgi:raffinose/stachyose/melibiose transport system permease protein